MFFWINSFFERYIKHKKLFIFSWFFMLCVAFFCALCEQIIENSFLLNMLSMWLGLFSYTLLYIAMKRKKVVRVFYLILLLVLIILMLIFFIQYLTVIL